MEIYPMEKQMYFNFIFVLSTIFRHFCDKCVCVWESVCMFVCLCEYSHSLSFNPMIYLALLGLISRYLSINLSIYLSIYISVYLSIYYLSIYLSIYLGIMVPYLNGLVKPSGNSLFLNY